MAITKDPEEQERLLQQFMYGSINKELKQIHSLKLEADVTLPETIPQVESPQEKTEVEKKVNNEEVDNNVLISVRVRKSFLKKIDSKLATLEGLKRNAWIVQAIQKQLELENVNRS